MASSSSMGPSLGRGVAALPCYSTERWWAKQGFGPDEPDDEPDPEDGLALAQAASLAGRSGLGARWVRRVQRHRGRDTVMPPRCAGYDDFTLHGATAVGGHDRPALERLCRTVARPALGVHLHLLPDGNVRLDLKTPLADGTTALVLSPADVVERLAPWYPRQGRTPWFTTASSPKGRPAQAHRPHPTAANPEASLR